MVEEDLKQWSCFTCDSIVLNNVCYCVLEEANKKLKGDVNGRTKDIRKHMV